MYVNYNSFFKLGKPCPSALCGIFVKVRLEIHYKKVETPQLFKSMPMLYLIYIHIILNFSFKRFHIYSSFVCMHFIFCIVEDYVFVFLGGIL
jgi:hypothetical protein